MNRFSTWISIFSFLIYAKCEKIEKIYLLPDRAEIITALTDMMVVDEAMSVSGLNDEMPRTLEYTSTPLAKITGTDTLAYNFSKLRFGRIITQTLDTIVVIDTHWDSAFAELKYKLKGNFKVVQYKTIQDSSIASIRYLTQTHHDTTDRDVDSTFNNSTGTWKYDTTYVIITVVDTVDSVITWHVEQKDVPNDSTTKSFTLTTRQKAIFLRTQNTNNVRKDWHLKLVTPIIIEETASSLGIRQVKLTVSGNPKNIDIPKVIDGDPLELFFNRDTLPQLTFKGTVQADVSIQHMAPMSILPGELAVVHFGYAVNVDKRRIALFDTDNNSVHSGSFSVTSHGYKVYQMYFDVTDYKSIFLKNSSYDAVIWMIPFRIP